MHGVLVVQDALQHSPAEQLWQSCTGVHIPLLLLDDVVLLLDDVVLLLDDAPPPAPLDDALLEVVLLLEVEEVVPAPPGPEVVLLVVSVGPRPFVAKPQLAPAASTIAAAIRLILRRVVATRA